MTPFPWSFTSYEDFVNCPRAFHAKRVVKTVKQDETEAMIWGKWVHKQFENRQVEGGGSLDLQLAEHEPLMDELAAQPGAHYTEQRYALNRQLAPCEFFSKDVWHRGIIDWHAVAYQSARVMDYKTGKPHTKFKQLMLDALWIFAEYPDVIEVSVAFYWTKTCALAPQIYRRAEIPTLWDQFVPDLKQYAEAFETDTWQPRPSGLCGWCPVTTCEHWRRRRS